MKKAVGAFAGIVALLIVGVVAITFAPGIGPDTEDDLLSGVKSATTNTLLNVSGIKDKAARSLYENIDALSAATGLSKADATQVVAELDVCSWEAAPLPKTVTETTTFSGTYAGIDGTVTLYDDPGYVTIETGGQSVTMKLPESAQAYVPFLVALQPLETPSDQAA